MINKNRLIIAYLLAPAMPAIIYYLWYEVIDPPHPSAGNQITYIVMFLTLPLSYLSCFLGGYFLVRKINNGYRVSLELLTSMSFVLGAILLYLYKHLISYLLNTQSNIIPSANEFIIGGIFGVAVAISFCLIAGIPLLTRR